VNQFPFAPLLIICITNTRFGVHDVTVWVQVNIALKIQGHTVQSSDDSYIVTKSQNKKVTNINNNYTNN